MPLKPLLQVSSPYRGDLGMRECKNCVSTRNVRAREISGNPGSQVLAPCLQHRLDVRAECAGFRRTQHLIHGDLGHVD